MEILWSSAEFNLRLKHLRLHLYAQEFEAVFGVWAALLVSNDLVNTVPGTGLGPPGRGYLGLD